MMMKPLALLLGACFSLGVAAPLVPTITTFPPLSAGLQAGKDYRIAAELFRDGVYAAAADKLRALLDKKPVGSPSDMAGLNRLLVEAYVRSDKPDLALEALDRTKLPDDAFWRGQALTGQKKFTLAEETLAKVPRDHPLHPAAILTRASILRRLAQREAAMELLKPLAGLTVPQSLDARLILAEMSLEANHADAARQWLDQPARLVSKEADYLRAQAALELGERDLALKLLGKNTANPAGPPPTTLLEQAKRLLLAKVQFQNGQESRARSTLMALIEAQPESERMPLAFTQLLAYHGESDPAIRDKLTQWSRGSQPKLQAWSLYILGLARQAEGRGAEAVELWQRLAKLHPTEEPTARARLLLVQELLALKQWEDAKKQLDAFRAAISLQDEEAQARLDYLEGLVAANLAPATSESTENAAVAFRKSAETGADAERKHLADINFILAALRSGDAAWMNMVTDLLEDARPAKREDMLFESGLYLAAKQNSLAERVLSSFIVQFPAHPKISAAHLALAEYFIQQKTRGLEAAKTHLEAAEKRGLSKDERQKAAWLRVWQADVNGDHKAVIQTSLAYLEAHPVDNDYETVRLKLGEAYFQIKDYANARTQFETLEKDNPQSPYAEMALFFAAKAAMESGGEPGMDTALEHFTRVSEKNGGLTFAARFHQAMIMRRTGQPNDALSIYDNLLKSTRPPLAADTALAVRLEKAETLAVIGHKDAERMEVALAEFRSIFSDPKMTAAWRNRAGYHLAITLREMSRADEALEICYEILHPAQEAGHAKEEELWLYRAGFEAMDMLEQQSKWQPAAKLGDKLAALKGSRAQEAAQRAEKIKLAHFLWEK